MENLYYLLPSLGAAFCAYRAMVSKHLLPSTLYLACVSALASVILYMLGAYEVAVIELSVGAGLVTILLVYALSVIGDGTFDPASIIPRPLAFLLVATTAILVAWMAYPLTIHSAASGEVLLADVLWTHRALSTVSGFSVSWEALLLGPGIAFSSGKSTGAQGASFQLFTHMLMKGLAFLAVAALMYAIFEKAGIHRPLEVNELSGAARKYPLDDPMDPAGCD